MLLANPMIACLLCYVLSFTKNETGVYVSVSANIQVTSLISRGTCRNAGDAGSASPLPTFCNDSKGMHRPRPRRVSVSMSPLEYLNNYFRYLFLIKYSTLYYFFNNGCLTRFVNI